MPAPRSLLGPGGLDGVYRPNLTASDLHDDGSVTMDAKLLSAAHSLAIEGEPGPVPRTVVGCRSRWDSEVRRSTVCGPGRQLAADQRRRGH